MTTGRIPPADRAPGAGAAEPVPEAVLPAPGETFGPAYVANLRRELTRALARLKRTERERDAAFAENARLRNLLECAGAAPDEAG